MKHWIAAILCLCMLLGSTALADVPTASGTVTIPDVTVKQFDIPDNDAMAFVADMKLGWNLGNTFDAIRDGYKGDDLTIESYWVGVKTTREMIADIKAAGFNTIRLPVSWHNHVDADFNINPAWLDRVQEVVDWCMEEDLYVILNTHHDVYPQYYYPSSEHYATAEKYITAIWSQLAERFKDYDHHLIFESMNEPRLKDTSNEWSFNKMIPECADAGECINKLNQVFVDLVRASGSRNADRYLMIPSYAASPAAATNDAYVLPTDSADNRLIVSVHAYTPYSFALAAGSTTTFSLDNRSQVSEIGSFMNSLYNRFVKNGIPVVIGEFGARAKGDNLQDRVTFAAYYVASARGRGITCCWWDNHAFAGNGELFGIYNRRNGQWPGADIVLAMTRYAEPGAAAPKE